MLEALQRGKKMAHFSRSLEEFYYYVTCWKNDILESKPQYSYRIKVVFYLRADGFVLSKRNRTMSWIRGRGYIYIYTYG